MDTNRRRRAAIHAVVKEADLTKAELRYLKAYSRALETYAPDELHKKFAKLGLIKAKAGGWGLTRKGKALASTRAA